MGVCTSRFEPYLPGCHPATPHVSTPDDLNAVLMQANEGEGAIHLKRVGPAARDSQPTPRQPGAEMAWATSPGSRHTLVNRIKARRRARRRLLSQLAVRDAKMLPTRRPRLMPFHPRGAKICGLPRRRGRRFKTLRHHGCRKRPAPGGTQTHTLIPPERQRQAARKIVQALRISRHAVDRVGTGLRNFLPHLLPTAESNPWSVASPA